jgi:Zn-dependent peptidase ImmA (M78 family)
MLAAPRDLASAQAAAMITQLDQIRPGAVAALSVDTLAVLSTWDDINVRLVPEATSTASGSGTDCSVAGLYIEDQTPPILAVAQAISTGRQAFTALHELGHHIQRNQPALWPVLEAQRDHGAALEEASCDAFAATILLPDALVDTYIGRGGPTAPQVVDLWNASSASRAAVCVRASQRLASPGHVVLLDEEGRVSFAASHGLPTLHRNSSQRSAETIREAFQRSGRASGRTRMFYRDGIRGEPLHAQIVPMGGFLMMVAVVDSAPWETFSVSSRESRPVGRTWLCTQPECGHEFTTFEPPCARCDSPTCPECGRCSCAPRATERRCDRCFLTLPSASFTGQSKRCNECS